MATLCHIPWTDPDCFILLGPPFLFFPRSSRTLPWLLEARSPAQTAVGPRWCTQLHLLEWIPDLVPLSSYGLAGFYLAAKLNHWEKTVASSINSEWWSKDQSNRCPKPPNTLLPTGNTTTSLGGSIFRAKLERLAAHIKQLRVVE